MTPGLAHSVACDRNELAGVKAVTVSTWRAAVYPLTCCAALLIAIALAHPFVDSAFNDDWSYSYVALQFAQTGNFHYSGWGSPTILFQTLWGAGWIRIFGFSFDVLRAATIPFSVGFVLVVYALGRRVGLTRSFACFGALTVATSPLLVPLAATFMTDVYGCFFISVCIYAAIACAQTHSSVTAKRWLWLLAASGIAGGSNRQLVWAASFVLIPHLVWLKRSDRRFIVHAIAAYGLSIAAAAVVLISLPQPYAPLELSGRQIVGVIQDNWFAGLALMVGLILSGLLVSLPALLCLAPLWKGLDRRRLLVYAIVAAAGTAVLYRILGSAYGLAPFVGNMLTPNGIMRPGQDALGFRPVILPLLVRIGLTWLVLFSAAASICLCRTLTVPTRRIAVLVFGSFSSVYILLLVPGAFVILSYDRYMLPLFPLLVIVILLTFQSSARSLPRVAWICLALFAAYSVATTHDYSNGLRARSLAAQTMEDRGIPRNRISAGFEQDGWMQLQNAGTIQVVHYNEPIEWNATDKFGFWTKTLAIKPDYVVSYWPASTLPANRLATIPFDAWFPPFPRAVVVLKREDLPKSEVAQAGN
jgi:hypothetical protein